MSDYCLTCCSTVDLTPEQLSRRDIRFACYHFELDGEQYDDDMGKSMAAGELFRRMKNGAVTRTRQVNIQEYMGLFESILTEGRDVLRFLFPLYAV